MVPLETFCLWPAEFFWAVMLLFMAKPSTLVILCGSCSWKKIQGGHGWHSILKYNNCTVYAKIVHTSKLRIYKPDEPGFFIIPCYVACLAVDNIPGIRSRKQGDTDGTSNIVLPCPGS
jgi:hypothetical protein